MFGTYLPERLLSTSASGSGNRNRLFSFRSTFWAFLSQALSPQTSCREVVRKVQSFCSGCQLPLPSSSTSAYCQARGRVPLERLESIHKHLHETLAGRIESGWLWLGHRVCVVDGTGIRLADTASNQAAYPQPANQQEGCGFPVMQVVACMCLHSAALIDWVSTRLTCHESPLLGRLLSHMKAGEVLLADRGFCSFANFAFCQERGIHAVMRLHQRRPKDLRLGQRLGKNQRLVTWVRPKKTKHISDEEYLRQPKSITVRLVKVIVSVPGFRVRQVWIATTLIDPNVYPKEQLAQLYQRRWMIELNLRDIKTSMGAEALRCHSPEMVHKELCMFFIAYNLLRLLIACSARASHLQPYQISFKAAADTLRQFRKAICGCWRQPARSKTIFKQMLQVIAQARVADRPNRNEPRAVKTRPKNYQRLTQPRRLMIVSASRRDKGRPNSINLPATALS
jgi:hypothetical protein